MDKPRWVSFFGWLAVAMAVYFVAALLIDYRSRLGPLPHTLAALDSVFIWPCVGLWLLGTIVHRLRVSGARIRARAMVEEQQRAGLAPVMRPMPQPAAAGRPTAAPAMICGECKRAPAAVSCVPHAVLLCERCWGEHHALMHGGDGEGMSKAAV